jgi:hypothetical protein
MGRGSYGGGEEPGNWGGQQWSLDQGRLGRQQQMVDSQIWRLGLGKLVAQDIRLCRRAGNWKQRQLPWKDGSMGQELK